MTSVANDVLVTTGGQFERLISPSSPRLFRHFSCKVLHNAEHVSADRAHLGWHPKLLKGTLESDGVDRLMNQLLQTVASADSAGALINLSRTSDRHRSVGFGFAMFHLLRSRGYLVELIHWNSSHWSEMARGGRNACCQDIQGSFRVLPHLVPNPVRSVVGHSASEPTCQGDGFAKGPSFSTTSIQDFEPMILIGHRAVMAGRASHGPVTTPHHDDPGRTSHGAADRGRDLRC